VNRETLRSASSNLGAEKLWGFHGEQPLDEGRKLLLDEGLALRGIRSRELSAKSIELLLEFGNGSVRGQEVLSVGNNELANSAGTLLDVSLRESRSGSAQV